MDKSGRLGSDREQIREIRLERTAIWSGENCDWVTAVLS